MIRSYQSVPISVHSPHVPETFSPAKSRPKQCNQLGFEQLLLNRLLPKEFVSNRIFLCLALLPLRVIKQGLTERGTKLILFRQEFNH